MSKRTPTAKDIELALAAAASRLGLQADRLFEAGVHHSKARLMAAAGLERAGLGCRSETTRLLSIRHSNAVATSQLAQRGITLVDVAAMVLALTGSRPDLSRTNREQTRERPRSGLSPLGPAFSDIDAPETREDWPGFAVLPGSHPRTLVERGAGRCCWPVGPSPPGSLQLFCSEPALRSRDYCGAHATSATVARHPRHPPSAQAEEGPRSLPAARLTPEECEAPHG